MQERHQKPVIRRKGTEERLLSVGLLLCALLLTRIRIHTVHVPFALALLLGITLYGSDPVFAAAGTVFGCLIGTPSWHGAACAILFTLVLRLAEFLTDRLKPAIRILLFLGSFILSLPLCLMYGLSELWYGLFCLAVTGAGAICFRQGIMIVNRLGTAHMLSDRDQDVLLLCWGLVILSLGELQVYEVSLSSVLILWTTMLLTLARGVYGTYAATLLSVAWVLYRHTDVRFVAVVTLGAVLGVPLCQTGRFWIAAGHLIASLLFVALQPEQTSYLGLINPAFASVLFLIVPENRLRQLTNLLDTQLQGEVGTRNAIVHAKKRTASELIRMGALLQDFSTIFASEEKEADAVQRWTVQGALAICLNCGRQPVCWHDGERMQHTVLATASRLENAQSALPQEPIPVDCPSFADLCASILLAYQQALTRDALLDRMERQNRFTVRELEGAGSAVTLLADGFAAESPDPTLATKIRFALLQRGIDAMATETMREEDRTLVRVYCKRYDQSRDRTLLACVGEQTKRRYRIVRQTVYADGVQILLEPAPKWRVSMRISQSALEDEENGDSYGELHRPGGKTLYALSDGMGSGKQAHAESSAAIETLFRLCEAGLDSDLIYENINRMLQARSREDMYATLDAVSFDLNNGTAKLLKFGTPPSYLVRGTALYTLSGEALPCGIVDDIRPTVIPIDLCPGDSLFLCTDGISDACADGMESLLLKVADRPDNTDRILETAQKSGGEDDRSIMVLKVMQ